MKVITYTITHQVKSAVGQIESIMYTEKFATRQIESIMYPVNFAGGYSHSIMYPANFAGGRSRLDLLLPSFLPSREEKKKQERRKQSIDSGAEWHNPHMDFERTETKMQDRIFCPLRGHAVGRMQYAPTTCRQETLFPINSRKERIETKIQDQKNRPLGSRGVLHTPHMDRVRTETKMQDRIFCPLRGHAVGRMQYALTSCRQERLYPINSQEERTETKKQEQKNHPSGSRGVLHTPHTDRVRTKTKMQKQIFCPLRGHAVGRMLLRPTTCRQETLFPINSRKERIETKMQEQKNHPLGSRGVLHTPHIHLERDEKKMQDRIFCPLRGHSVGRMRYAPTTCRQETLFPINSREERIETKIQEQKNRPLGSRGVLHTPHTDHVRTETKMQERRKQSIDSGAEWHNLHMDRVRIETKKQDRIFCPLRGHSVGRMQYAPTSYRQESMFQIILLAGKDEKKKQDQKNHPLGCRGVLHTPPKHLGRDEKKIQDRIFCPLRGHSVGRMLLRPTTCRQETLFPINSLEERTETKIQDQKNRPLGCRAQKHTPLKHLGKEEKKMQERRKQSIDSGAEWHTPFMRQGERDAVWRDTFLEQRARVAIWQDRRLEEKYSHARFQMSTFGENSKPYKSSLVALSEQLRDIFAA